jgi:hypothetical protein
MMIIDAHYPTPPAPHLKRPLRIADNYRKEHGFPGPGHHVGIKGHKEFLVVHHSVGEGERNALVQ